MGIDYEALQRQTLGVGASEEQVTVNQRALIGKQLIPVLLLATIYLT